MKKLLTVMFLICITMPTLYAQTNKLPSEEIQWGSIIEVTYTHLKEDKKFGWYMSTEYGARFAPANTTHLLLGEVGLVYHLPGKSTTVTLLGVGGEYNFKQDKVLPVLNTAIESRTLGIGVKGIFEDGVSIEASAIKYFTIAKQRFAFGGAYLFKQRIPLLKITIPFERWG